MMNQTPRRMPRPLQMLLGLLAVALLATACGSSGSDSADDGLVLRPVDETTDETETGSESAVDPASETADETEPEPVADGPRPPDIEFTYFDGTTGTFDDFDGSPTVINFFAGWCAPCVAEMPEFEAAFQKFGGEVDFVGFAVRDTREESAALIEQTGVTYTIAEDTDQSIHFGFGGIAMPTTVFLDQNGNVVDVWIGILRGEDLEAIISEELLT